MLFLYFSVIVTTPVPVPTLSNLYKKTSLFLVTADRIEALGCAKNKCNDWRMQIFIQIIYF